jgi:hypothetical protein
VIGLLLALALGPAGADARYEALLAEGLARGKAGEWDAATAAFDEAILLDPARPEARIERGGVAFAQNRYDEAAADLRAALRLREDDYARDLLGSSLFLAGRADEALAAWNASGKPTLGDLQVLGLQRTRDRVARREIGLAAGDVLRLGRVREARLRLAELGTFERIAVRPVPRGSGVADLEVALVERRGLAMGWLDFVTTTTVNALQERVRLRYSNIAGEGVGVGFEWRWEKHRPLTAAAIDWPRPFGLDAVLHVRGFDGRQDYAAGGDAFELDAHGAELGLRRVLGARTVAGVGIGTSERRFSTDAHASGRLTAVDLGVERTLADAPRARATLLLRGRLSGDALGSDESFGRGLLRARGEFRLVRPLPDRSPSSVLAAQVVVGQGSGGTPVDQAFAAGGSPDMELPIRAHPQAEDGLLGAVPLSRSIVLGNLEWRQKWARKAGFELGSVAFYDGACLSQPGRATYHDVGLGLRLSMPGAGTVRVDWGHGLTDGANAFSIGLGQVF